MKPTYRAIFLVLFILLFGAATVAHAFDPATDVSTPVNCDDPTKAWGGEIADSKQIDYYSIVLEADQLLAIDVDADGLSSLDSLLEVFDGDGNLIDFSNDNKAPDEELALDPYIEITAEVAGSYYFSISAATPDAGADTGRYDFFLKCSDPSLPPPPVEPVKVGDLLGGTGSNPSSLHDIDLETVVASLRFPFPSETGLIADMDYDPISKMLFIATNDGYPGKIIPFDPDKGNIVGGELLYDVGGFVALESAGDILYGVHLTIDDFDNTQVEKYSLVTITQTADGLGLENVASLAWPVSSLAYHSSEKMLYGVASISSPSDLFKIQLGPEVLVETVGAIQTVGEGAQVKVVALDFSHENVLYGIDDSGNLFKIDHTNGQAESIGLVAGVTDLSFVVGNAPPDEEPIKTLCSSTLTSSTTVSSETDAPKLSKLKLKNNPLHRAIGLFKFKGRAGETVTLKLASEVEEAVVTGEYYAVGAWLEPWLEWRGKGRVFLGIRDAIPNIDFRVRKKDQMPFDMSAGLPADGYYYVMVIRPLLRFYKTDYCLTLESDHPDSEAWQTLDVVWPGDDSEEDTTLSADETKLAEPLSVEAGVVAASEPDNTAPVGEPVTVAPEEAYTELAGETLVAPEAALDGGSDDGQPTEDAAVEDSGAVSSDESDVKALREPEPDDAGVSEEGQAEVPLSVDESASAALEEPVVADPVEPEPVVDSSTVDSQTVEPDPVADSGGQELVEPVVADPVEPEPAVDSGTVDSQTVQTDVVADSGGQEPVEPVVETPQPAADDGGDDPIVLGAPPAD
jgi:hypothetical protein